MLDSLLSNVIKYSLDDGQVSVCVCRSGDWAVLQVRDHGVGIPAQDLPRVFEPAYRGRNVEGWIAGSGLGLAGVRRRESGGDGTRVTV